MVEPTADQNPALPPQGAAPGAAPAAPQNTDPLAAVVAGYLSHLTQNQPPPVSSVMAQKQASAAAQKPVDTSSALGGAPPQSSDSPAPGSFGDKLKGAFGGVMDDLGDAAHAHDTKGGWFSGVANTLNARRQRLDQEKKDAALLAKTQAETVMMHRNIYQQETAQRQQAYAGNQSFVDTFKVNHDITNGVTQDELQKNFKDNKNFANEYYVRATGEEPLLDQTGMPKRDKNGNPITTPTYTLISRATKDGQPDDKEVTPEMSAGMQKYLGQSMPKGTKLTGLQYASLDTALNNSRNSTNILQNANGKEFSDEQLKSLSPYLTDPTIQSAISHVPGSAYAGLKQYSDNANLHILQLQGQAEIAKQQGNQQMFDQTQAAISQITEERDKVMQFTSTAVSPKQIEDYDKKQNEAGLMLTDLQKKADGAHGEEAAAIAAGTRKMLEDHPEYGSGTKQTLQRIIGQTEAAAKASQEYKSDEEKRKQEVTNALAEGDTDVLVDAALHYQLDPNKLYSMRKNTNAEFKAKMLRQDSTWSELLYKQRYDTAQSFAIGKPGELAVRSLNKFALHTGDANELISTLQNTNSPLINKPLNAVKLALGNDKVQPYEAALEAARTEYLNFLNNQHALTTVDKEMADKLIDKNSSPAASQAVLRQMAKTIALAGYSFNSDYKQVMGQNIPGLLTPKAANVLKNFGINPDSVYSEQDIMSSKQAPASSPKAADALPTGPNDAAVRPKNTQSVLKGSDGKWYYFGPNKQFLSVVPDQFQGEYNK